jgi:glycosyltransferase involved in cell wall biosynthesis
MSLVSKEELNGSDKMGFAHARKPLVSLLLSAYNEEAILEDNLSHFVAYLTTLEDRFEWEIILINDGSIDSTGVLGEKFSKANPKIKIFHHHTNYGLGKGIQTAIENSKGDYVITYDVDLSMSTDHIEKLLQKIIKSKAKVVIASPMLKGGKFEGMPAYRKILSFCANRFLSFFAAEKVSSLTSMARAYDGDFIRSLNLRSIGMEIMPEIIYKTTILHERIEEIPAGVVWHSVNGKPARISKMRIFRHTLATLFTGFLLKPFLFFILPGLLFFLFALYPITWLFLHFFHEYSLTPAGSFLDRASEGLASAYQLHPHTFLVSFFSLFLSIQLIALGFHSLQNKHYFEELFNFMTKLNQKYK